MTETATDKLDYAKKIFCELASRALPIAQYLRYKKDIMQTSSMDNLNLIVKNLCEEICQ